jgi:hypothetical protein
MTLPEFAINTPTIGKQEAFGELEAELKNEAGALEFELKANVPAGLQKAGEYRVIIGKECILCEGKAEATKKVKVLTRNVGESSTKEAHAAKSEVFCVPTREAQENGAASLAAFTVGKAWVSKEPELKANEHQSVALDKIVKDAGGNFHVGAGEGFYTTPSAGWYLVNASISYEVGAEATALIEVRVNTVKELLGQQYYNKIATVPILGVTGILFVESGKKIELGCFSTLARKVAKQESQCFLTVCRVA